MWHRRAMQRLTSSVQITLRLFVVARWVMLALIALGFLGKAFVRWERDGRRAHIFNPSAFTLAVFSVGLLATGATPVTWAQEINATFALGPHIYTVLFLIGLIVMYFFAITPVTSSMMRRETVRSSSALAVIALCSCSLLSLTVGRRSVLR